MALFICVITVLISLGYIISWESKWQIVDGAENVQVIKIDTELLGISPSIYWLATKKKLVLLGNDQYIQVIDVKSHNSTLLNSTNINLDGALSLKWDLQGNENLNSVGQTKMPHFDLKINAFSLVYPGRTSNFPFGGDVYWKYTDHYFGRFYIDVGDTDSNSHKVRLRRFVWNTTFVPPLRDWGTWLPNREYLVLNFQYDDGLLYIIGPFNSDVTLQ